MREQIMKHRSAFHTLFRKNSPTVQRGRANLFTPAKLYPRLAHMAHFMYAAIREIYENGAFCTQLLYCLIYSLHSGKILIINQCRAVVTLTGIQYLVILQLLPF